MARSELPPSFPIHYQIPGFTEAHAIQISPELLGPAGPWAPTRSLPTRITCASAPREPHSEPLARTREHRERGTRRHAGHMSKEVKSPSSDPRLDVLKACAVLHLHVRYVIKPADPKNALQASHVESLQAIYIRLEQGPGFHTMHQIVGAVPRCRG